MRKDEEQERGDHTQPSRNKRALTAKGQRCKTECEYRGSDQVFLLADKEVRDGPEPKNKRQTPTDVKWNWRVVLFAPDKAVTNDRMQASQAQCRDRKARKTKDEVIPLCFQVSIHILSAEQFIRRIESA